MLSKRLQEEEDGLDSAGRRLIGKNFWKNYADLKKAAEDTSV